MTPLKTAEPELWNYARELPYKESNFSTTERNFTPSWPKRQAQDFKPLVLKKIGAHTKN